MCGANAYADATALATAPAALAVSLMDSVAPDAHGRAEHCEPTGIPDLPFTSNNPKEFTMASTISTLQELYLDELKDLWSANDQMGKALKKIAPKATNAKLKKMLDTAQEGIEKHTTMLKGLIDAHDTPMKKEHCKGMEGLAAEALKHTIEEAPQSGPVLDASIIAQYQRMTHYGITGFGTVAAFAKALKLSDAHTQLSKSVKDMYQSDELMTELAEGAVNAKAV